MSVNVSTETIIERDRASIAAFVTDPGNDRSWIGGVTDARRLDDGTLRVGSRISRVARFLGRRFEYTFEIVELKPDERLVMTTNSPFPMMVTYEFEDAGVQTLVRIRVSGQPRGFFRIGGSFLNRMVRGNVTKDLVRLRGRMESPQSPATL